MRIERKLRQLRERREGALMPHVYYGDPTPEFSFELVRTLAASGADLLEVGVPFSDPIADGPVFTAACERALSRGIKPRMCIAAIERLRSEGIDLPVVVTAYYNIVYNWGVVRFCADLQAAGADGIIVPDLPVEESEELLEAAKDRDLDLIFQVAPTTSESRIDKVLRKASGFVYVINVEGVTGPRGDVVPSTLQLISRVRERTSLPLLAGFGVSSADHARLLVANGADGVVVGSAIAEIYSRNLRNPHSTLERIRSFVSELKAACVQGMRERKRI